jgi:S1-C subfamily serine protease/thiol-disulfide isomerase/thioredoxin
MQHIVAKATIAGAATAIAAIWFWLIAAAREPVQPDAVREAVADNRPEQAARSASQSFEDLQAVSRRFADQLGRLKEQNQTISPAILAKQAGRENSYAVAPLADPGRKLDTETLYTRTKPGVVVVGGIYKCTKCKHWHSQCASGFVVRPDGLIVTALHVVEGFAKLEAMGVMTDAGRVFPVTAVLASSRLNDLALLKAEAEGLRALPLSCDAAVGAKVYCLSHPVLPNGKGNCFYTFSPGVVCGKFTMHTEKEQSLNVLAVSAEYGPGSSGGPILNERGAVVGMACQALPLGQRGQEKDAQMVWRFGRPSASIQAMLTASVAGRNGAERKVPSAPARSTSSVASARASSKTAAAESDAVTFELHPHDRATVEYYRPVQIKLSEEPPLKPKAEPRYESQKPLYGVLQLGDGPDNRFLIALDETADGRSKIYIDGHGDGDLAAAGPGDWDRNQTGTCFVGNVTIEVPYPTGKLPFKFCFYRLKTRQPNSVFCYHMTGREGEVVLDGNRYRVLVLDDNGDGRFDDLDGGSLVIDLNQDGTLEGSPDSAEYFHLNEPFNVRGKVWQVASLSADGLSLSLRPSSADVPVKPYLTPGNPAPEFTGQGLDGASIDLRAEAAKSRYVIVDFWASWCGPCRAEFPTLQRVRARYKNHGLRLIGVNLDSELSRAVDAAEQAKLSYPHVFDGRGWKNAVALLYRVRGIPQIYLLDNQLRIVARNLRGPQLESKLRELLGPGDEISDLKSRISDFKSQISDK